MKSILFCLFIVGLAFLIIYIHARWTVYASPLSKPSPTTAQIVTTKPVKHDYTISYGTKEAPHTLISFFDIGCTHCATFFREKFPIIKRTWVDNQQLRVVFKPYPIHQETVLFMSCCEGLTDIQKLILFETLMETESPTTNTIQTAMEVLKCPFKMPTVSALKEALTLTTTHEFTALPMMFFDDWPLSDEDQDDLIHFLQEV